MNNKIYILLFLLSFLMPLASVAQRVSVRGVVRDAVDNEPLPRVSVRILQLRDSAYVAGTTGNNEGIFRVNDIPHGNYIVQFSFLGYSTQYVNINTRQVRSQYNMGEILMSTGDIVLAEATVVGKAPEVVVKEDTVEFNADSYKTQPSAVVEDLLKRLPGVEVDETGKITANGKEVTKILLDGKEFFSDDPKVASKNIPVEMVQKLQVVDRKSDLARITGVDDGEEETVINLTIKPGMKQGWFGEIQGGYGYRLMNNDNTSPHRYQGGAMVNYIKDDDQFTLILNSNNVNSMGFTDQGQGRFRHCALIIAEHAVYILAVEVTVQQHHRYGLGRIPDIIVILRIILDEGRAHEHDAVHMAGFEQLHPLLTGRKRLVRAGQNTVIPLLAEGALQHQQRMGLVWVRHIRAQQADGLHGIQSQAAGKGIGDIARSFNDSHDLFSRILGHVGAVVQHAGNRRDGHPCTPGNIVYIHRRIILFGFVSRLYICSHYTTPYYTRFPMELQGIFLTCFHGFLQNTFIKDKK